MTTNYICTYERQAYIPEGFEQEPTTPVDALRAARAVLEEEDRWMQGQWFINNHPEVDPEDAFCNDWKVCAEGAVAIVTTGLLRARVPADAYREEERVTPWAYDIDNLKEVTGLDADAKLDLYGKSNAILARAGKEVFGFIADEAWKYNDHFMPQLRGDYTRTKVLAWFDKAIELAEQEKVNT